MIIGNLRRLMPLETKSSSGILNEEREKIVDILIDNYELKGILSTGRFLDNEAENQIYSATTKSTSTVSRYPPTIRMNRILE